VVFLFGFWRWFSCLLSLFPFRAFVLLRFFPFLVCLDFLWLSWRVFSDRWLFPAGVRSWCPVLVRQLGRVGCTCRCDAASGAGRVQLATKRDETRRVVWCDARGVVRNLNGRADAVWRRVPVGRRVPFCFFAVAVLIFLFFEGVGARVRFLDVWVGPDWADGRR
jgi:hypothetical protein